MTAMRGDPDTTLDGRDLDVLRFLADREVNGEGPPSTREVARAAGLKSPRSGYVRLRKLAEVGHVEVGEGEGLKRRPVKLTRAGWEAVGELPGLGVTVAGPGTEAVAQQGVYSLVAELATSRSGKRRYVLEVSGQSMVGAGIEDGDELVVEEDESPPDGAVVVALLQGETTTVKRLYREADKIRLKAENPDYEDLVVDAGDVVVQGRVIRVLHPPRRP